MNDRPRSVPGPCPDDCFTGLAAGYDRHRPHYPAAVIATALEGLSPGSLAADVGCGTGISTRLLAAAGAKVTGIDPNDEMLREARRRPSPSREIRYVRSTAEHTGLEDESIDLVLCAQSFHWFDERMALNEFHRILKPGGRLALLWNVRRGAHGFTAGYNEIARRAQDDAERRGIEVRRSRRHDPGRDGLFAGTRSVCVPNPQPLDWTGLLGRAHSASYYPREGPLRQELDRQLRLVFDRHQVHGFVTLDQETALTLADVVK